MRTDTLYGLLALASSKLAVEKVYAAKGRDFTKPCIVLVASVTGIPGLSPQQQATYLSVNNKRPTTLVVPATQEPHWLTRGHITVAYRVCTASALVDVIKQTGPLIAPSANPQGQPPANTIALAKRYFGDTVALYIDGGDVALDVAPSQIATFDNDKLIHIAR